MLAKRYPFALAFMVLFFSTCCLAQKADVAFVAGGSFVSDSKGTFSPLVCPITLPSCPTFLATVQTDHRVFLEGALAVQLFNAKLASLHVEVPVAGIPSQKLTFSTAPSSVLAHLSSTFLTPGLRLKLAPGGPISPFVSLGAGWARYSLGNGATNKGALQFGGGVDFKTGIPHLGLRGEVRDFVTGDPSFAFIGGSSNQSGLHRHNILAGGGVVVRF